MSELDYRRLDKSESLENYSIFSYKKSILACSQQSINLSLVKNLHKHNHHQSSSGLQSKWRPKTSISLLLQKFTINFSCQHMKSSTYSYSNSASFTNLSFSSVLENIVHLPSLDFTIYLSGLTKIKVEILPFMWRYTMPYIMRIGSFSHYAATENFQKAILAQGNQISLTKRALFYLLSNVGILKRLISTSLTETSINFYVSDNIFQSFWVIAFQYSPWLVIKVIMISPSFIFLGNYAIYSIFSTSCSSIYAQSLSIQKSIILSQDLSILIQLLFPFFYLKWSSMMYMLCSSAARAVNYLIERGQVLRQQRMQVSFILLCPYKMFILTRPYSLHFQKALRIFTSLIPLRKYFFTSASDAERSKQILNLRARRPSVKFFPQQKFMACSGVLKVSLMIPSPLFTRNYAICPPNLLSLTQSQNIL